MALLSALESEIVIPVCAIIGIAFSLALWCLRLSNDKKQFPTARQKDVKTKSDEITSILHEGVISFLRKEYQYAAAFVITFAILIFLCLGSVEKFSTQSRPCKFDPSNMCKPALATAIFSTVSFLLGASTSVVSAFLGTRIAIYANKRTVFDKNNFVQRTSVAASRTSAVMGFLHAAIGLLVLYLAILLFKLYYGNDWEGLFEAITGYGLGGSFMALFGRAGGGIYAKAADVCHHLVEEIMPNIPKDDRNPAVIPNYVGDILGNIAGMGPDLFASYAESSCAALVVASISSFGINHDFTAMCYPLLISSMGILVCLITTIVGIFMPGLKMQLVISTILMTGGSFFVSWIALPSSFTIYNPGSPGVVKVVKYWELSLCVGVGLWAGLIIGFINEIYTNKTFRCLRRVAGNSVSVSLGSVSIPFFATVSILASSRLAGTYGIAVAALGMLSTIATRLAIDAYGPISHNAEEIAKVAGRRDKNRGSINVRDAAGDTTAATGKGFPIESAALVSIALFGAFVSRPAMYSGDVLTPKIIIGLSMGAWLPHYFSAMTMKSVGRAVLMMAPQVREKLGSDIDRLTVDNPLEYYTPFFDILTDASVKGVILPGAIVMLAPLVVGTVFGVETLSGLLAGSLGSIVQIAISASNTDKARKKANEHIRDGAHVEIGDSQEDTSGETSQKEPSCKIIEIVVKTICHSCEDTSSEIVESGEITGDSQTDTPGENDELKNSIDNSQKDTSGPPFNILIQLMAVESLVFAPFFAIHGGLFFKIL